MAEKEAELGSAQVALQTAQAEAAHQEELAEMAKGELDEYKRRMAAEVDHARQEALKSGGSASSGAAPSILADRSSGFFGERKDHLGLWECGRASEEEGCVH